MDGYERRKQKKIGQIFDAATALFFKYGFQKISVNEIAERAKVSPATIYNYFGTKEQLYTDTMKDWMDKQLAQYIQILEDERPFPEKTREIMLLEAKNLKLLTGESSKSASPALLEMLQWMENDGEQKFVHFFRRFVAQGQREGCIHSGLSAETAMRYFTMFTQELGRIGADDEAAARNIDQWLTLFFYGLAGTGKNPI